MPASASAAITLTPNGNTIVHTGDNDGIISPGETFELVTRFNNSGGGDYAGGRGQLVNSDPVVTTPVGASNFTESNGVVGNDPSYPAVDLSPTQDKPPVKPVPFQIALGSTFQCGKNVSLGLNIGGSDGQFGPFALTVPTGAPGVLRTYQTSQIDTTLLNASVETSLVTVPAAVAPDSVTDFVRGVRIHIDALDYKYTPHWLKLEIVAPDGKTAVLFDDSAHTRYQGTDPSKQNNSWTDLTFVNKGDSAGVDLAANPDGLASHATIQSEDDLTAVLSGAKRSGQWKLRVTDVQPPSDARSNRRSAAGRSIATGSEVVGKLGDWQLGVAAAVCGPSPSTPAGPDAWFGGPDPLILDPTGGTLTATSVAATSDDPTNFPPATISNSGYAWDTHTGAGAPSYTDGVGTSITFGAQSRGTKVVKLKVTDSAGRTSEVQRTVIVSETPTVDALTATPTQPQAGETATLNVAASDSFGAAKIVKIQWISTTTASSNLRRSRSKPAPTA